MKKNLLLALIGISACLTLAACGKKEKEVATDAVKPEIISIDDNKKEEVAEVAEEPEAAEEELPEGMYYSELTGLPISLEIQNQKPIAAMVDNESSALPHYGLNTADIIYEMVNSTANDRVTRLMVIYKDWGNIEQLGSIRSIRPTNIWVAGEYNAVMCHDGGPFYIDAYLGHDYAQHFSGIFSRVNNGKAREFTEYIVKGDLEKAFADSSTKFTSEYDQYYEGPHFKFATKSEPIELDGSDATKIDLSAPFKHNKSMLQYDSDKQLYEYYEYGSAHVDGDTGEVLTFKNVILQKADIFQLDKNGYMAYDNFYGDNGKGEGLYITNGKSVKITWEKKSENGITHYFLENGDELTLNAGMTYIGLVPSDYWDEVTFNERTLYFPG